MNKAHFEHVTKHFSLENCTLSGGWLENYEGRADLSTIEVANQTNGFYAIFTKTKTEEGQVLLFRNITHEQATEIIEYIKTTAVLYI